MRGARYFVYVDAGGHPEARGPMGAQSAADTVRTLLRGASAGSTGSVRRQLGRGPIEVTRSYVVDDEGIVRVVPKVAEVAEVTEVTEADLGFGVEPSPLQDNDVSAGAGADVSAEVLDDGREARALAARLRQTGRGRIFLTQAEATLAAACLERQAGPAPPVSSRRVPWSTWAPATVPGLSQQERDLFDLLGRSGLSTQDTQTVKATAKSLRAAVDATIAGMDRWSQKEQTKAIVEALILDHALDHLPATFTDREKEAAADRVYQHVRHAEAGALWIVKYIGPEVAATPAVRNALRNTPLTARHESDRALERAVRERYLLTTPALYRLFVDDPEVRRRIEDDVFALAQRG